MNMDVRYRVFQSSCRASRNGRRTGYRGGTWHRFRCEAKTSSGSVSRQPGKDRHDL